jgi:hypothetical protein
MAYRIAADAVVLLHLGFIVFALAGGLLVLRCAPLRSCTFPRWHGRRSSS